MKAVYLYEVSTISSFTALFLKKYCRENKKEAVCGDISFMTYGVPVSLIEKNRRNMQKFIGFLREEEVSHILLDDALYKNTNFYESIGKVFYIIEGNDVINYKLFDILRKCALEKNVEPEKSTLVLITDFPQKAENVIMSVYKNVKKIRIKTNKKEAFENLTAHFMNEYGLYIEVSEKKCNENELSVLLDEKSEEKFDVNASRTSCKTQKVIYKVNNIKGLDNYFNIIHQSVIEFLILQKYGFFSSEAANRFFRDYHVRIRNFKKAIDK